jgi:hypothetical protein
MSKNKIKHRMMESPIMRDGVNEEPIKQPEAKKNVRPEIVFNFGLIPIGGDRRYLDTHEGNAK